jgi:hypothetical protein
MNLTLILVWITTALGWLLYRKFIDRKREYDSLGVPYETFIDNWIGVLKFISMKVSFVDNLNYLRKKYANEKYKIEKLINK